MQFREFFKKYQSQACQYQTGASSIELLTQAIIIDFSTFHEIFLSKIFL
jgi:hypothetical protein